MRTGHFEAALGGVGLDGGDLLLVPVDEEDPLAARCGSRRSASS